MQDNSGAPVAPDGLSSQAIEVWRPVANFEDRYEISSLGRLRSLYFNPPRMVKAYPDKDGYPVVSLWREQTRREVNLHRLVGETFHGHLRNVLHREVAHLDGDRTNCRADNLRWVSKVENHHHRRAHGTHPAGEKHPRAKLTIDQVRNIRTRYATAREIANDFNISPSTVSDIWLGRRWSSVA